MNRSVLAPFALAFLAATVAACSGAPDEGFGDAKQSVLKLVAATQADEKAA